MINSKKDRIYANKLEKISDFTFDGNVAQVFEDMIERSVPGYGLINNILPIIANYFIKPNTNCYDLGCSVGEASIVISKNSKISNVKIFAIDDSQKMIEKLNQKLYAISSKVEVNTKCSNVLVEKIINASFIVLNFTMQFIDTVDREYLINKCYSGLNYGGALLVSEKIIYDNLKEERIMQAFHEDFKRSNAYSDLEISQKREALENVLVRDTHEKHVQRFKEAGFKEIYIVCKYFNFITYLAIK